MGSFSCVALAARDSITWPVAPCRTPAATWPVPGCATGSGCWEQHVIFPVDYPGSTGADMMVISNSLNGPQGNGGAGSPQISADGGYITFTSGNRNLVLGDMNER